MELIPSQHATTSSKELPLSSSACSWRGPRTLTLTRDKDGFGFTLRYFVVQSPLLPQDSNQEKGWNRNSYWDEFGLDFEDWSLSGQNEPLPLDTFFVKNVSPGSPADKAGLNRGDRIVSVNGHLIGGQTYEYVAELIQYCDGDLKLGVVPRNEDILQLVCQKYVYNAASLESLEHITKDLDVNKDLDAMSRPSPSANKWSTVITTRKPSTPETNNNNDDEPVRKFDPCVSFIGGAPASDGARSHSNSVSSSGQSTPAFFKSGTTSPGPTVHRVGSTISFTAGRPVSGEKEGSGGVPALALNTALKKQQARQGYGRRLAPKVIAGVNKEGAVSKIAGKFAEGNVSNGNSRSDNESSGTTITINDKPPTRRKASVTSVLKDDFRIKILNNDQNEISIEKADDSKSEGSVYDNQSRRESIEKPVGKIIIKGAKSTSQESNDPPPDKSRKTSIIGTLINTGIERTRKSSYDTGQRSRSNKHNLSSQTSQATLVESKSSNISPKSSFKTSNVSPSSSFRKTSDAESSSKAYIVSPGRQRKLLSRFQGGNRKLSGSSVENSDDDSRDGSGDEVDGQKVNRKPSYTITSVRQTPKIHISDTIDADDEDSDVNSSSSRRLSSAESLDEDEEDSTLPVIKEGHLHRKLERSIDRKRASARTWKQVYVVLRGHKLFCYKDRGGIADEEQMAPINVDGSTIEYANDYVKRKHVFRVATASGNDYLFQADNQHAMVIWVNVLRDANPDKETQDRLLSPDLENSQSPPSVKSQQMHKRGLSIKKSHFSLSRVGSKKRVNVQVAIPVKQKDELGRTFGNPLHACPQSKRSPLVPLIVEHCCTCIEERGKDCVGIYRVPGNAAAVLALQAELDTKEPEEINWDEEKWYELTNISSLLKSYLRKLPEPVIPSSFYDQIIQANRIENVQNRLLSIKNIIKQLPEYHYCTLKYLIEHLRVIADNSEANKMEPKNIAIVFGPTIVRPNEENMVTMVKDMSDQCKIIEIMLYQCEWIFGDAEQMKPQAIVDQSDLIIASRGLMEALETHHDLDVSKKDKKSTTMHKGLSSLKSNISLKIKSSTKGVSPTFKKRAKGDSDVITDEESDEELPPSPFTRSYSTPAPQRIDNKVRLGIKAGAAKVRSSVREVKVTSSDTTPTTKIGNLQVGTEMKLSFSRNKSPQDASPSVEKDFNFDAYKAAMLSEKTRMRLHEVNMAHQHRLDCRSGDEDMRGLKPWLRDEDEDAMSTTSDTSVSSRKESLDSLSGPSPMIHRRTSGGSRQKSGSSVSSSDDRSPTMQPRSINEEGADFSRYRKESSDPIVVPRRKNQGPFSPHSKKRELYCIYPGDAIDDQLQAMLSDSSSQKETLSPTQRPSSNSDWWLSGGSTRRVTPTDKETARSIISNAIDRDIRRKSGSESDTSSTVSSSYQRWPDQLGAHPAELSARVDTFKQKKEELDKKVSTILGSKDRNYRYKTSNPNPQPVRMPKSKQAIEDETKAEKLDRYLQQVTELLKDSQTTNKLQEDDRRRLSMILQNLQKAVLYDSTSTARPPTSEHASSVLFRQNVRSRTNSGNDASGDGCVLKYSKLYSR